MPSTIQSAFDLTGRVALVTGAAGLLGKQFCRTLVQAGASVALVDLNPAALAALQAELGERALAVECNVSDKAAVQAAVQATLNKFGRLDILVNSAALDPKFDAGEAGKHSSSFEDYSLENWNNSLSVNLTGAFLFSQASVPHMLSQGRGAIINICSTYGLGGPDQRIYQREGQPPSFKPVDYTVTKAGILGLTKYLATYYGTQNIRVNALTPGGVRNTQDEEFVKAYSARAAMGRMANQDEMNGALLFLASDASSYMTGANLVVDGGWTAW